MIKERKFICIIENILFAINWICDCWEGVVGDGWGDGVLWEMGVDLLIFIVTFKSLLLFGEGFEGSCGGSMGNSSRKSSEF
jgi:hypothetical protein